MMNEINLSGISKAALSINLRGFGNLASGLACNVQKATKPSTKQFIVICNQASTKRHTNILGL